MEGRQMAHIALQAARKRQSSQTGLVHYCYESTSLVHDTIPLYENACFALALFRSRLSDNVLEGKALLEKILSFQVEGNFPIYLHEFPVCRSINFSFHFLPVFAAIQKDFSAVLGEMLRRLLSVAIEKIVAHGEKHQDQLAWASKIKLLAYLQDPSFIEETPTSVYDWSEYLIASQMLPEEDLAKAFRKASAFWNASLGVYVGLETHPKQEKDSPKASVYDFFLAESTQSYPKRLFQDSIVQLQAVLVMPHPFVQEAVPGVTISDGKSFIQKYFGGQNELHSFSFDASLCQTTFQENEAAIQFVFEFPEEEMKEGESGIGFFVNRHEDISVWVGEKKATFFSTSDTIFVRSTSFTIQLEFEVQEKNTFAGHISYDNRKSQVSCKGENRFEAFDYKISLRSLRRAPKEIVRAKVSFFAHEPLEK